MNQRLLSQSFGTPDANRTFAVPSVPLNCLLAVRVGDTFVEYTFNEDHSLLTLTECTPRDRELISFIGIPKTYALDPSL
jgi:hypothetical protein